MNAAKRLRNSVVKFHKNEAGLEALQVVMILAIAAICLVVVKGQWPGIKKMFNDNAKKVSEFDK